MGKVTPIYYLARCDFPGPKCTNAQFSCELQLSGSLRVKNIQVVERPAKAA